MIFNILAVILGVSTIVGIHEACHMLVSKLFGVKVFNFSLGFGPILLSKKIKETSYELRLLPLGGFIRCEGDNPDEDVPNGFFTLPPYKRALIALAGPTANLILGFAIIYGLLVFGYGWPILSGLVKAFKISAMIITTTLSWLFGASSATSHTTAQASTQTTGLAGPIMVTKILFSSLKEGVSQFLFVLSLISLSLGLFNLFPIPAMDGGHVFLYALEGLRGKKFSTRVYSLWSYIGLLLLGGLMLFLCFSDILNLLK